MKNVLLMFQDLGYEKTKNNEWLGTFGEEIWLNKKTEEMISLNKKLGLYYKFREGYDSDSQRIQVPLEISLEEHNIIHQFLKGVEEH